MLAGPPASDRKWGRIPFHLEGYENIAFFFIHFNSFRGHVPQPPHAAVPGSPTDVHQLVQFRAAALVHVPAAHVALVH